MHSVIYLNKSMVEATKARVAPVSSAMLYGRGLFITLAIYNSQPFLWSKHWQRRSIFRRYSEGSLTKVIGQAFKALASQD